MGKSILSNSVKFGSLPKKQTKAFGKKIYLLGEDADGIKHWLEEPSWDCDWYWGFGYIETYTNNNNPSNSRDIESHTHWDSPNQINYPLEKTTFSKDEFNRLKTLFKQFYTNREKADKAHNKNILQYEQLNHIVIPKITAEIIKILSK